MTSKNSRPHKEEDQSITLGRERTRLARERTILAHIRTGVSSFVFGTVLIGFFKTEQIALILGGVVIVIGILFFISAWMSYIRSNSRIHTILEEVEDPLERK